MKYQDKMTNTKYYGRPPAAHGLLADWLQPGDRLILPGELNLGPLNSAMSRGGLIWTDLPIPPHPGIEHPASPQRVRWVLRGSVLGRPVPSEFPYQFAHLRVPRPTEEILTIFPEVSQWAAGRAPLGGALPLTQAPCEAQCDLSGASLSKPVVWGALPRRHHSGTLFTSRDLTQQALATFLLEAVDEAGARATYLTVPVDGGIQVWFAAAHVTRSLSKAGTLRRLVSHMGNGDSVLVPASPTSPALVTALKKAIREVQGSRGYPVTRANDEGAVRVWFQHTDSSSPVNRTPRDTEVQVDELSLRIDVGVLLTPSRQGFRPGEALTRARATLNTMQVHFDERGVFWCEGRTHARRISRWLGRASIQHRIGMDVDDRWYVKRLSGEPPPASPH